MVFPCLKCHFTTRRYRDLIFHYQFVHAFDKDFSITCGIDGCQKVYRLVSSLKKHIRRKHPSFNNQHMSISKQAQREPDILNCFQEVHEDLLHVDDDQGTQMCNIENENIEPKVDFSKKLALFLLTLRERCKVPDSSISLVVNELSELISLHHVDVSKSVIEYLEENNFDINVKNEIKLKLAQNSGVENACSSLGTSYKFNKYIETNMSLVKPIEFILGQGRNGKQHTMQYVPILDTLRAMLMHDDVFSYVINTHKSNDGILRDICDGTICQDNYLFSNNQNALQILLFFDEFTVTNPIGHSIKQYKIGGFYMIIANIPPKYRSHINSIQLVALVKSVDIKQYGYANVLAPFLHDMNILETEGINVSRPEGDYIFQGSIIAVIGDNLGAHSIGGFVESFTTMRFCRFCFLPKSEMQKKTDCTNLPLRTKEMYEQQIELVSGDPNLSSVYGIKNNSVLNQLDFFHVIGGMPSDIAHDLFEGVVPTVATLVIDHCVRSGYFSLEYLNEQIDSLEYSELDKPNKPGHLPTVLSKLKVSLTAAQSWCFCRLLPLMICSHIPIGDDKWEVFLLLQDVIFNVCAPSIKPHQVHGMRDSIEDFLEAFLKEFPDQNLKPKFHFLLHYPQEMTRFGPLLHLQTLRFEAKHSYFKELAQRTKCRKNICKSLAMRHQNLQCISAESQDFLKNKPTDTTGGNLFPIVLLPHSVQVLLKPFIHEKLSVFQCRSVEYNSIKYFCGTCFIEGHNGDQYDFCKIEQCYVIDNVAFILCKKLQYIEFKRHLNVHVVRETNENTLIDLRTVSQPCTVGLYKVHNTNLYNVALKYNLF